MRSRCNYLRSQAIDGYSSKVSKFDCQVWTGGQEAAAPGNLFEPFPFPTVLMPGPQVLAKLVARSWLSPLWLVLTPSRRHLQTFQWSPSNSTCVMYIKHLAYTVSSTCFEETPLHRYSVRPQCLMLLCGFISIILQNTHWQQHHRICTPTL